MAFGLANVYDYASAQIGTNPFGEFLVDTSYDQPRTAETVTQDIVSERQTVTAGGSDAWGDFWLKAAGTVLDYGIKRDAAMLGAEMQAKQPKQPVYAAPALSVGAGASGLTVSPLMLVLGAVVAVIVLSK